MGAMAVGRGRRQCRENRPMSLAQAVLARRDMPARIDGIGKNRSVTTVVTHLNRVATTLPRPSDDRWNTASPPPRHQPMLDRGGVQIIRMSREIRVAA